MCEKAVIYIIKNNHQNNSYRNICQSFLHYAKMNGIKIDKDLEMVKDSYGKPSFVYYPKIHFSISHSGECWACVFFKEKIGLDIEKEKKIDHLKLAKRFFHPDEAAIVHDSDSFFRLWTLKESYAKYIGKGIDENFSSISILPNHKKNITGHQDLSWNKNGVFFYSLILEKGYFLSVCSSREMELEILIKKDMR